MVDPVSSDHNLDKAACDDWTKIPVHCAECGGQFLRKVRHQIYCDEHRHLGGAVIRPQEATSSKTVTWREIVTEMGERFTSLNSIPVERATIRRHEWEAILQKLHDVMPSDETSGQRAPMHVAGERFAQKFKREPVSASDAAWLNGFVEGWSPLEPFGA